MKKIITLLLSALLCLFPLIGTGCFAVEESSSSSDGVGGGIQTEVEVDEKSFTAQLTTADGSPMYFLGQESLFAIWTEIGGSNVYQAPFDKNGLAVCNQADGEYLLTLSKTPAGYTYNPNGYRPNNDAKRATIELYPLRDFGEGTGQLYSSYAATTTGAYRFTFENASQQFYFYLGPTFSGKFSLQSLLDVTQNEVLPKLYKGHNLMYDKYPTEIVGGGAENTYTKNFYYEENLTGSNELPFKIGVETRQDVEFPVVIDILISKTAYEGEGYGLTMVEKPNLLLPDNLREGEANGAWKAKRPSGTFVSIANSTRRPWVAAKTFNQKMVVEYQGIYYMNKNYGKKQGDKDVEAEPDLTKPLYAVLTRDIQNILWYVNPMGQHPDLGLRHYKPLCPNSGKNYTDFIQAYYDRVNTDGSYPVDKGLQEFLADFSEAQRIFFDGYGGLAESNGYKADSNSRWLFVCGYYV